MHVPLPNDTTATSVRKGTFYVIYLLGFLTAFHLALPLYIESSFLENVMNTMTKNGEALIGLIYSAASLVTVILFLNIARILRAIGNFKLSFTLIAIEAAALLTLALVDDISPLLIVAAFIVHLIVANIIYFNLDLFLESYSDDESTGTVRGTYFTAMNVAFVIAPFLAGLILTDSDFWKIFFASGFIMIPSLLLLYIRFRDYEDKPYDSVPLIGTIKEIWRRKDIYHIMMASLLLNVFYSWMVIYTPIYLNKTMEIPFSEIVGIIIPIALLPFILFQFMLGRIADSTLGEKEILIGGFTIMGVATAVLSFVTSSNVLLWAALLFMTRVGASSVEIMTETYFYKKIDATDAHLIGSYKNLRPLSYLIAPPLATVFLVFFDPRFLFLALGMIMFLGVRHSLAITDTK